MLIQSLIWERSNSHWGYIVDVSYFKPMVLNDVAYCEIKQIMIFDVKIICSCCQVHTRITEVYFVERWLP